MSNVIKDTFKIDGENNPLMVMASICIEKENGEYSWSVSHIHYVELVIGGKVSIDITKLAIGTPRTHALISSQVADCDDQIIASLLNSHVQFKDENEEVDQMIELNKNS